MSARLGGVQANRGYVLLLSLGWSFSLFVDGRPLFGDCGVETSLPVGDVVYNPDASVGFHKAVLPFHHVTVAFLPGSFDVACVRVVDAVLIGVQWMILLQNTGKQLCLNVFTCCTNQVHNVRCT